MPPKILIKKGYFYPLKTPQNSLQNTLKFNTKFPFIIALIKRYIELPQSLPQDRGRGTIFDGGWGWHECDRATARPSVPTDVRPNWNRNMYFMAYHFRKMCTPIVGTDVPGGPSYVQSNIPLKSSEQSPKPSPWGEGGRRSLTDEVSKPFPKGNPNLSFWAAIINNGDENTSAKNLHLGAFYPLSFGKGESASFVKREGDHEVVEGLATETCTHMQ